MRPPKGIRRAALVAVALLTGTICHAEDTELHLLFVQGAAAVEADTEAKTISLVGIAAQTIYFSDRPNRVAGIAATDTFVEHWATGEDSFASNPPNATLMIYDRDTQENQASVLVLKDPVLAGDTLSYHYELLAGNEPANGGAAGLFIDTFGPGGGVGASYHGVGVGARGPGATGWRGVARRNCADGDCD